MRKIWVLVLAAALVGCHGDEAKSTADGAASMQAAIAVDPAARAAEGARVYGDYYGKRVAEMLKELEPRKPGGTVVLGDSITQQFPAAEIFPNSNAMNQGIGGDRVRGVIDRLDLVKAAGPDKIYLMIGSNDHNFAKAPLDQVRADYTVLAEGLRKVAPDADVTMLSIIPLGARLAEKNASIRETNALLPAVAKAHGFEFVDLTPWVADADGNLREDYTVDGVHLTARTYEAWLEAVVPDKDLLAAEEAFAPRWRRFHGPTRKADKVDPKAEGAPFAGNRGEHELVVYTPAYGKPSTGTNIYGSEAVVEDGRVTAVLGGDSPIPSNGFVVSGHGESAAWVVCNLRVGRAMSLESDVVRYQPRNPADLTNRDRLEALVGRFLMALPTEPPLAGKERKLAEETIQAIRKARASAKEPTDKELGALEENVAALENIQAARK